MHKLFKMAVFTLLAALSFHQVAFATSEVKLPPKPTEGIESSDPRHGSSTDTSPGLAQRLSGLFYDYYCSIENTGTDLYLEGATVSNYLSDQVSITLYLQQWNGSQWSDIQSWSFNKNNARSITEGARTGYQRGNYYRTRAVHYIKYGTQTETQNTMTTYIYIE